MLLTAAVLSTACHKSLERDAEPGFIEGETGYVNISINLPTTSGNLTKAEEVFDAGSLEEYEVNEAIVALFYGETSGTAKCYAAFSMSASDFQVLEETDNVAVKYATGVRMIPAPDEGENVYALAILNPNGRYGVKGGSSAAESINTAVNGRLVYYDSNQEETDLTGKSMFSINEAFKSENVSDVIGDGFMMTNAPVSNYPAYTLGNMPEDFNVSTLPELTVYHDINTAQGAAAANPVYVQRVVAKTSLKVSDVQYSVTGNNGMYDGATVTFTGWAIQNANKFYYLLQTAEYHAAYTWNKWINNFNESPSFAGTETNRFIGSVSPYRVYWSADYNYGDVASFELDNHFKIIRNDAEAEWKNVTVGNEEYNEGNVAYCYENTTEAQEMTCDHLTSLLIKAKFSPAGIDGSFFIMNSTSAMTSEDAFVTWAQELVAGVTLNPDAAGGSFTTVEELMVLLSGCDEEGAWKILDAAGGMLNYYKDGICYYNVFIEHFGDAQTPLDGKSIVRKSDYDEVKHLGRYGVMRNNWYELSVSSVSGPGSPEVPELPSDDPVDKRDNYINCQLSLLSWAKRVQDVIL